MSQCWGVALLLGVALLFAGYLWSARESNAVQPLNIVMPVPAQRSASTSIEVIPYQHEIDPTDSTCSVVPTGGICFIIGSGAAAPAPMTFT